MVNILDKIQVFVLYRNFGFINELYQRKLEVDFLDK
jgi:hypothetical protein